MTPSPDSTFREAVRKHVENSHTRCVVYLHTKGLALDFITSLDQVEIQAWMIILGEIEGGVWNWDRMCWAERD